MVCTALSALPLAWGCLGELVTQVKPMRRQSQQSPDCWTECHCLSQWYLGVCGLQYTPYLVDSLCAGLLGKELHLNPSGIVVTDGQVGPAIELKGVHPEACPWTIWEGWRKKGFLSLWMVYGICWAFVDHFFYIRWNIWPPNWGPCQTTALGVAKMTFMKTVEGVKSQASGNDQARCTRLASIAWESCSQVCRRASLECSVLQLGGECHLLSVLLGSPAACG